MAQINLYLYIVAATGQLKGFFGFDFFFPTLCDIVD